MITNTSEYANIASHQDSKVGKQFLQLHWGLSNCVRPDVPRILCLAYNLLSPIFIAVVKELSIPPFQLHVLIHIRHLFALSCPFVSHSGCSSYTLSFLFAYHHSLHQAISWIYIGSLSPLQQKKESFRVCVCVCGCGCSFRFNFCFACIDWCHMSMLNYSTISTSVPLHLSQFSLLVVLDREHSNH